MKVVEKNVVLDIVKESEYQKIKKKLEKKDDYFTLEELKVISVILA